MTKKEKALDEIQEKIKKAEKVLISTFLDLEIFRYQYYLIKTHPKKKPSFEVGGLVGDECGEIVKMPDIGVNTNIGDIVTNETT